MSKMDPLKSGAIFHIKNIAAIRSPAVNVPVTSAAAVVATSDRNASHVSPSLGDEQAKMIKQKFDQIYRATPVPTAILGGHMSAPLGSQSMYLHPSPIMMKSPYQVPQYTHNEPYGLMGPPIGSPRHTNSNINNNSNDYHYENTNDDDYILHSPTQAVVNNDKNNDNKTNNNDHTSKKRSQLLKNDSLLNLGKVDALQPATVIAVTTKSVAAKSPNYISPPPAKLITAVPKKRGRKKKSPSIMFNPSVDKASTRDSKVNTFEPVYVIEDLSPDTQRRNRKGSVDSDQEDLSPDTQRRKRKGSGDSDQEVPNENSNDSYDRKTTRSGRLSQPVMRLIDLPKLGNKETVSDYLEEDDELDGGEQADDDYVDETGLTDRKRRGRKKNSVANAKKAKGNKQPMIVQHVPDNYQSPPKKWDPRAMTVLYRAHAAADASDPNFWESVSDNMKSQGIDKDADECQQLWFQSLQEAQRRKNNKIKAPQATASTNETVPTKKKGKAELKRLAEEVAKADKEDDLFDYRRQLNENADQALQVNTYVDSGISEEFGDVISPLGPQHNKNGESPVDDTTTTNDWKASYVHNLSRRVATITNSKAAPTMNKLGSTVKPKNKVSGKKVVEGGISGLLDFKKGKINVVLANNNSDVDEEDIVDTEDDA